jgi:hypothetical protein
METKLVDMGNGVVGIKLGAHVARAIRFAPGDVIQITIEGGGLKVIRKPTAAELDPNDVNCSNLWEHATKFWTSVGQRS